jgi:hypothetical protein
VRLAFFLIDLETILVDVGSHIGQFVIILGDSFAGIADCDTDSGFKPMEILLSPRIFIEVKDGGESLKFRSVFCDGAGLSQIVELARSGFHMGFILIDTVELFDELGEVVTKAVVFVFDNRECPIQGGAAEGAEEVQNLILVGDKGVRAQREINLALANEATILGEFAAKGGRIGELRILALFLSVPRAWGWNGGGLVRRWFGG